MGKVWNKVEGDDFGLSAAWISSQPRTICPPPALALSRQWDALPLFLC
jgi:hypothetical protein